MAYFLVEKEGTATGDNTTFLSLTSLILIRYAEKKPLHKVKYELKEKCTKNINGLLS